MVLVAGCASTQEGAPASGAAPAADASSGSAFYTVAQATRGNGLFRDNCASCHASSEFAGSSFVRRWSNRAVGDIYEFVLYSMPEDNPGGLPQQTYAGIQRATPPGEEVISVGAIERTVGLFTRGTPTLEGGQELGLRGISRDSRRSLFAPSASYTSLLPSRRHEPPRRGSSAPPASASSGSAPPA